MFLRKKINKITEEISELELAIDMLTIYDPSGFYREEVYHNYVNDLIKLIDKKADLEKKAIIYKAIFGYSLLILIYSLLFWFK